WGARHASVLGARPVAYFSAEFGLHESIPIYSGGLGILAGDHLKSASDLGIPLVGVGLYYDQGYFKQRLDADGGQQEDYLDAGSGTLPTPPATTARRGHAADPAGDEARRTHRDGDGRDAHRRDLGARMDRDGRPQHAPAPRFGR